MNHGRARRKGIVFVVSGPSGCGKTTLCDRLLKKIRGLVKSTSVTTRLPRKSEARNRDYIYITGQEFKRDIKKKRFLEYAEVFGSYYGTRKSFVRDNLKKGRDVLLSIDVQGAAQVKKIIKTAVFIFILPPSFADLKRRLLKRDSDTMPQIKTRLEIAHRELRAASMYDYTVVNDNMKEATEKLAEIVAGERRRLKEKE